MRFLTLAAAAALLAGPASAQISLGLTPTEIDFNSFQGTGFAPTPAAGQLDSDDYDVIGSTSGGNESTFGDTQDAGVFARGTSSGGVTTGGVYAFETAPGDFALGLQPTGSFFGSAGGFLNIRFQNDTGSTLYALSVQAELKVLNDNDRVTGLGASVVPDVVIDGAGVETSSGSPGVLVEFTQTPATADADGWSTMVFAATANGIEVSPGENFYLRFFLQDVSGSGARDQVAFDDISVTALGETLGSSVGQANENTAGWRMLAPIATGSTIADLSDDNRVQGVAGSSFPTAVPNLYLAYDGSGTSAGFVNPPSVATTTPLESGKGFIWYLYDSDVPESDPLPDNVDYTGAIQTTNVTATFDFNADGFYLGGNPFNQAFELSGLSAPVGFVVGDAVSVWDPVAGSYETLSAGSGDIVSRGQGLFAEMTTQPASGSLALTYDAASQNPTGTPLTGRVAQLLRSGFTLSGLAESGATTFDRSAYLVFADEATTGHDAFDGTKLQTLASPSAEVAFVGDRDGAAHYRAQESRPMPTLGEVVTLPLAVRVLGESGTYTLQWPGLAQLPADWAVQLTDAATGTTVDLRTTSAYSFVSDVTTTWDERFTLTLTASSVVADETTATDATVRALFPNPASGSVAARVALTTPGTEAVTVSVYDAIGRLVEVSFDGTTVGGGETTVELPTGLAPGVYVVRIAGTTFTSTQRLTVLR